MTIPLILALDVATTTGFCIGRIDQVPRADSVRFSKGVAHISSNNAIFANALTWISDFLEPQPRPDIMILEAMLPMLAMQGETSRAVRDRLAGLHGIMRGTAYLKNVGEIAQAQVGDVRMHFLGTRTLKSAVAKAAVMERCQCLGWAVPDHNAADACSLWSYARALIDPKYALVVSPLFNQRLRVSDVGRIRGVGSARQGNTP